MSEATSLESIYIHTAAGTKYFPFAPKADQISIFIIAHHLATDARWSGATQHPKIPSRIFYSVAEHSVYVSRYLEEILGRPDLALEGLLHDGTEAVTGGDLIRPLKHSAEFHKPFKKVEDLSERALCEHFSISFDDPLIKVADEAVCAAEYAQIVPRRPDEDWSEDWHDPTLVAPYEIQMLLPHEAKQYFMSRFVECWAKRRKTAAQAA